MYSMNTSALSVQGISLCIICLFNLGIGIFVLAKQPRNIVHRAFAIVTAGIFTWGLGLFLLSSTRQFAFNAMVIDGFLILLYGLILFAKSFPNTESISRQFAVLTVLPLIGLFVLAPTKLIISGGIFREGFNPEPINGPLFPLFLAVTGIYILGSIFLFVQTFRKARGHQRAQMQYFITGLCLFVLAAFLFDVVLPAVGIFNLNFLGPISSILLTGATAYAIVRHNLMDIRIAIQRGVIYFILLGVVVGLYVAALALLGRLLVKVTDMNGILSAGITMTLGIFFWEPLRTYLQKVTDPFFFRHEYNYAEALHRLSHIQRTTLGSAEIVAACSTELQNIFKTNTAEIVLADTPHSPAERYVVSVPITLEEKTIGTILLGEKRSGDGYSKRDMQLLATFALQAAVSLEKGRLFQAVQEHTAALESLVEKRTGEIKKLQEEQRQAMIDISHNLQTPLAIIRNQAELLRSDDEEENNRVERSLTRVSGFIRQLLSLSRLESSAHDISREDIDLGALIREQAEYFEVMAAEQNIRITTDISQNATISGNKRLLEELLTNLVVNAISYRAADRPGHIQIRLAEKDGFAEIQIEDNGIGIAKEDIPELFTRFYRAKSIQEKQPGSGLGLAIARQIMEKHAGTISVSSVPNAFTIFSLRFPLRKINSLIKSSPPKLAA